MIGMHASRIESSASVKVSLGAQRTFTSVNHKNQFQAAGLGGGDVTTRICKGIDYFGQGYSMRIDEGSKQMKSWGGAICSFMMLVIIFMYGLQKL